MMEDEKMDGERKVERIAEDWRGGRDPRSRKRKERKRK
jgi:hypothetical protein